MAEIQGGTSTAACGNTRIWGTLNSGFNWALASNRRFELTSLRSDLYRRIVERLIQARKDAGVTQAELGRRIGQRQTFVSKVELLERRIDVAEFIEICRAIPTNPSTLIREAEGG